MRYAPASHRIWSLGRFPAPPLFHSIRKYSDTPRPSSDSSKATSPAKKVGGPMRDFFKVAVQDGFHGTFEEFSARQHFHSYERAVKLGRFQGTYDAWRYDVAHRKPGNCAYISTLRLDKVCQTGQFVGVYPRKTASVIRRPVLVNGQAIGDAMVYIDLRYRPPKDTLLRVYYEPDKQLLRFQTQDGTPLPNYTDIDLISKAGLRGYQPLLVLAHSEGLIFALPDGHLPSFDLQTNMKSGYYLRANRSTLRAEYRSNISLPDALGITRVQFRLSGPENFEYLRFFPYIHEDQTFRLWDVERGVDAPLKKSHNTEPWAPEDVKKRSPGLFEHAKRLGYWKDF